MKIDLKLLCIEATDLMTIKKLMKKRSADSKEVADFTKKYGLGTPEWQSVMIRRINNKLKGHKRLNDLDLAFMHLQLEHTKWVDDQLKSMGVYSQCMN
jgi:hypothetical protein